MYTIYKYPFPIKDRFTLDLPVGARILKAECQGGEPCLWAVVEPGASLATRSFVIFGTGHPIDDTIIGSTEHVATFQQGRGVWHLFHDTGALPPPPMIEPNEEFMAIVRRRMEAIDPPIFPGRTTEGHT